MSDSERPCKRAAYFDLFERLWGCAFLVDLDEFTILDVNSASERVLGEDAEALIGQHLLDWVEEKGHSAFQKGLRIARRRYYPRKFDSIWKKKEGGTLTMEISACVLKLGEDEEVIQLIAQDVTEIRETERKAKEYLSQLQTANAKLEAISITDEMTQLSNFRQFKKELAKEHERSERYGSPYSIVFIDVDHFKKYNDQNGHPAGDRVLIDVAKILKEQCRNTDLPARYGGEEFVVLCPGVTPDKAAVLAERIRKKVEEYPFEHAEKQPLGKVSVSIGVSGFPTDAQDSKQVLKRADDALYRSKKDGRNRITISAANKTKKAA